VKRLCLTDRSIKALESSTGKKITGVFVTGPRNRGLEQAPAFLAIALSNGTVLNLYPKSTRRDDASPAEYFRLEIEPSTSPLAMEYSPGDPVRWTVADPLMRALVGDLIKEAQVVHEDADEGVIDVGVRLVTERNSKLYVSAEQAGLPMTLAIEFEGSDITQ
jgi:hypothetical protein